MNEDLMITVNGHCFIDDDLGQVYLDQCNAVHPQNLSRVFSRALSNESNYYINRIAFGNGGTITDVAFNTTYKPPNDGYLPDNHTYDSRLYNETFSKIINEGVTGAPNPLMGTDPGSSDDNGMRIGGGSVPSSDIASIPHVSGPGVRSVEMGVLSKVVIYATLNKDEPVSQYSTDSVGTINATVEDTESLYIFDEIGLYTAGAPIMATSGYHNCNVGNKTSTDIALQSGTNNKYCFGYKLSKTATPVIVKFEIPGDVTYGQLCDVVNMGNAWNINGALVGCKLTITDSTAEGAYSSIAGDLTNGFLTLIDTDRVGDDSYVELVRMTDSSSGHQDIFKKLNNPVGADIVSNRPIDGRDAGYQNAPTTPTRECERLLTHLIFSPIRKAKNRRLNITYTLTINVARTPNSKRPI